ncbi:YjbF family lipoprotein [Shewanella putrefaciens]|jgi:hypothetical protein|nr:YjbF family lipoprotein [uncultured Shewanella sp.]QYX63451.1 YjbF family lipoprotein [Shewanella putrefaciens]
MRISKTLTSLFTLSTVLVGMTGCSQKISAFNDTVKFAFIKDGDIQLTNEQVNAIPYASIYVKVEDGSQSFVVLAFADPKISLTPIMPEQKVTELKWLSVDNGMLVTVNGRLVKTHNFLTGNLAGLESTEPDPLLLGLHLSSTPKTWTRTIDWQPGYHYGYKANSQFEFIAAENIVINGTSTPTLHYSELVTVEALDIQYQNEFWLKPDNGKVIKSHQKIAPNLPFIDITLLKPFAS